MAHPQHHTPWEVECMIQKNVCGQILLTFAHKYRNDISFMIHFIQNNYCQHLYSLHPQGARKATTGNDRHPTTNPNMMMIQITLCVSLRSCTLLHIRNPSFLQINFVIEQITYTQYIVLPYYMHFLFNTIHHLKWIYHVWDPIHIPKKLRYFCARHAKSHARVNPMSLMSAQDPIFQNYTLQTTQITVSRWYNN